MKYLPEIVVLTRPGSASFYVFACQPCGAYVNVFSRGRSRLCENGMFSLAQLDDVCARCGFERASGASRWIVNPSYSVGVK